MTQNHIYGSKHKDLFHTARKGNERNTHAWRPTSWFKGAVCNFKLLGN